MSYARDGQDHRRGHLDVRQLVFILPILQHPDNLGTEDAHLPERKKRDLLGKIRMDDDGSRKPDSRHVGFELGIRGERPDAREAPRGEGTELQRHQLRSERLLLPGCLHRGLFEIHARGRYTARGSGDEQETVRGYRVVRRHPVADGRRSLRDSIIYRHLAL